MAEHGRLIDADALIKDISNSISEMTKIGIVVDGEWLWGKLLDALENAPTIEPEPQWIPCSERLPDEFDDVFCSTDAEEVFIATYLGKMNDGTDCFDDDEGMMWEGDVIAWMPLPEPYGGE